MDNEKIVVILDICSSTRIVEELSNSGQLTEWGNVLSDLSKLLEAEQQNLGFEIYKFTGDGWIFFFNPDVTKKADLIAFFYRLSDAYISAFKNRLKRLLSNEIDVGITVGVDKVEVGSHTLLAVKLAGQTEYVGMPINLASRLQGAIKDNDKPEGRVLMSRRAWCHLGSGIPTATYRVVTVKRNLRNISPMEDPVKLYLYEKPLDKEAGNDGRLVLSVKPSH